LKISIETVQLYSFIRHQHTVNPLHDRGDMALRLNGSQSQLTGFQGLVAIGEPPMSGDLMIIKIIN
jgi:hypothetical protein